MMIISGNYFMYKRKWRGEYCDNWCDDDEENEEDEN